ncbi:hypothetical protein Vau01_061740 [Virgisporangium aurantiacum]|uniref:Ankyrin repeat-containing protein n=1 Tax=Virgisporangium aurantiacum TaxID=175570 RepID=A0A8J3ZCD3_9ACTN|nr:hypothetical protein Vau01_061740 [Virgisporangium aurantiacum]
MSGRVLRRYDLTATVVRGATERRLAGDWRGACAAARIDVDPRVVARARAVPELADDLRHLAPELIRWHVLGTDLEVPRWRVPELARYPGGVALVVTTRHGAGGPAGLTLTIADPPRPDLRPFARCFWDARHAGELPAVLDRGGRPWYLNAVAAGELAPAALPPLVRTALFPDRPDEPYAPAPGIGVPDRIHVQCRGRHYVGWRDGALRLLSHDPEDERREQVLQALGGPVIGCFRVRRAWERRVGRLPDRMRAVARHMFLAASHGDLAELTRLLDAGVDPRGVRGPQQQSLLHLADQIADAELIQRLLHAGLDPSWTDNRGRRARDTDWLSGRRRG